jgi:hypothetical protein
MSDDMPTLEERALALTWVKLLGVDPADPSRHYDIATAVLVEWRSHHHEQSKLNKLFSIEQVQGALEHCLRMRNTLRDAIPDATPPGAL